MKFECMKSPLVVLHRACKSNDSSFLGQRLGKHVTFREDMYELQPQRFSHAYQIGSRQIYQND